jgi:LCP family protein required for cell wall assembly
VISLAFLVIILVTGGIVAYRTKAALDTVHSISTPPPELSGSALGGDEHVVIDTGPAQEAIRQRQERDSGDRVAANIIPTEPAEAAGGSIATEPGNSTSPAGEQESPASLNIVDESSDPSLVEPAEATNQPSATSEPGGSEADSPTSLTITTPAAGQPEAANNASEPAPAPILDTGGTNVLLMGVDARDGESIDIGVRPDSLAVLHLEDSGACRILSVPRDSRAELPGYGQSKINHALAVGGIEYEVLVIEEYLGIEIDHYALVDFEGVTQMVDSVGGITVDNPSAFDMDGHHFSTGEIHLDGEQALLYSRFRGNSDGDFGRISRQQEVLRAMLDKAASANLVKVIPDSFRLMTDHFRTDYGVTDLLDLANAYRGSCTSASIETNTIPGDVSILRDDLMQMDLSFVVTDSATIREHVDWLVGTVEQSTSRSTDVPATSLAAVHEPWVAPRRSG